MMLQLDENNVDFDLGAVYELAVSHLEIGCSPKIEGSEANLAGILNGDLMMTLNKKPSKHCLRTIINVEH